MKIRHIFTLLVIVLIASCTHEVINSPKDPASPIDVGGGGTTPRAHGGGNPRRAQQLAPCLRVGTSGQHARHRRLHGLPPFHILTRRVA